MFKRILMTALIVLMPLFAYATPPYTYISQAIQGFSPATPLAYRSGLTFALSATGGGSGMPVVFSSQTPAVCSVSGNTATALSTGTCTIAASQAGKTIAYTVYNAAPLVTASVVIYNPAPTISVSFSQMPFVAGQSYTGTVSTTNATSLTGGCSASGTGYNATFNTTNVNFSLPTTASASWVGYPSSCTYIANGPGGSATFNVTLTTVYQTQTISFPGLATKTYGAAPFGISASTNASLPVSFSSGSPSVCSVSSSTVSIVGGGTCTINANAAGSGNFGAAAQAAQSFTVSPASQSVSITAIAGQTVGAGAIGLSASATSGLPVTFSSATPSICSVSGSNVYLNAVGSCTVVATQSGNNNYSAATNSTSFTIGQAGQSINFTALAGQSYGGGPIALSASATSGLPITFSSATPSICPVSGSTVYISNAGSCTVTATQSGNTNYGAATPVSRSFTISPAAQSINFGALAGQTYGVAPFAISASATSGLAVAFTSNTPTVCTVSGSTVTIVAGGTCAIAATQAGNGNYNAAATSTQSFTVAGGPQSISVAPVATQILGVPPFTISATASSGLAVAFSSATPSVCTVSGATVTLVSTGNCTIYANQAGNTTIAPAAQVTLSFTVQPHVAPTVSLSSPANGSGFIATTNSLASAVANVNIVGSATGAIQNIQVLIDGNAYGSPISGTNVNLTAQFFGGAHTIELQTTDVLGATAVSNIANITVGSGQTIAFGQLQNQPYGVAPFALNATASSNLPVAYTSNTPSVCTVSGSTVTLIAAGTCTIAANQAGSVASDYEAAPQVTQSFNVIPASQTISFNALSGQTTSSLPFVVTASASSNLPVTFSSGTPSVCTVSGSSISIVGSTGTCTINANQAGNSNYSAAPQVAQTFAVVQPTAQSISFPTIATQYIGSTPFALSATASSGLAVTFSSANPSICTVSGAMVTLVTTGSCTINVNQSGNSVYGPAPQVAQSFTVQPYATPTVSMSSPTDGGDFIATTTTLASASANVNIVGSAVGAIKNIQVLINGSPYGIPISGNSVNLTVSLLGGTDTIELQTTDVLGATAVSNIAHIFVGAGQTISFAPISDQALGTAPFSLIATASSNLPVAFSSSTPLVCTVSGSTVTLVALGTCTVAANQAGSVASGYIAAPQVTQSFNVTSGTVPTGTATVTLSAINNNVRITSGTTAAVTFAGSATEAGVQSFNLALYQNSGGGYGSTPVWQGTGANMAPVLNLSAGSYLFYLQATDANNAIVKSTPIVVNVTNSSLLGQANGVEIDGNGHPQLFGWVCQPGNATGLAYQVYLNAPSSLGGTLLTSGTANVSGQFDDSIVQTNCGTTGSSHDFTVDLSSYTSQYSGTPIYVQAPDANGNSVVLPCNDNTCSMPGSLSIGLKTPSSTNTDQYSAPATVFMRALLTNGNSTGNVAFILAGPNGSQIVPAIADTTPGAYYASVPNLGAGVYTANALIEQGDITLYSTRNIVTVVPGNGSTIALTSPTAGSQGSPVSLSATAGGTAVTGATVLFYENGSPINSSPIGIDQNGNASYQWVNPVAGSYAITARLFSSSGAPLAESAITMITVAGNSVGVLTPIGATPIPVAVSPNVTNLLGNADAGSLPGSLSVGNNGAATYSIPIAVPPGTAGLAPTLALNYSSLAGNGIAGFGWSLAGGSGIHRCVRTVAQDGYAGPINLNSTDALCLDGVRLLLASGTYGQSGATYRTELDNFARITQLPGANGQSAFTVETKAGQLMIYGDGPIFSGNATVQVIGKKNQDGTPATNQPALFWDLAAVMDRANNAIQYHYNVQDPTTGEHLLQSISYGNSSSQYNNVAFTYECRNGTPSNATNCTGNTTPVGDADIEYLAGARVDMRHRLKTISTSTDNGVAAQTTTLTYSQSPTSQRSLLTSIQACAGGACLPATTFNWGTATAGSNAFVPTTPGAAMSGGPDQNWGSSLSDDHAALYPLNPGSDIQQRLATLVTGDFYGDGKQRILTADQGEGSAGGSGGLHIYTVNATQNGFDKLDLPYASNPNLPNQLDFGVPAVTAGNVAPAGVYKGSVLVADFDGDGKADFAFFDTAHSSTQTDFQGTQKVYICLSRLTAAGGGFDCQTFDLPDGNPTVSQACTADYNNTLNTSLLPCTGRNNQAMFWNTQTNGRSDLLFWSAKDPTAQSNQRCSYVPPTANAGWTWSCSNYPGFYQALLKATSQSTYPYNAAVSGLWPAAQPSPALSNFGTPLTSGNISSANAQRSYVGDFLGTGQGSFIAQYFVDLRQTNSAMFAAVANNTASFTYIQTPGTDAGTYATGGSPETNASVTNLGGVAALTSWYNVGFAPATQTPNPTNQFVWSNGGGNPNVTNVYSRYLVRESRNTELGGTSLGDLNGDGYTDYLMTFEGHAEICYSNGIDGFNCQLMEEMTPSTWTQPNLLVPAASSTILWHNVSTGMTVPHDSTSGLIQTPANSAPGTGVFSVLSVGHANDTNLSEVIYRRGDGGAYNGGLGGGAGANQYWVCTVRDGMKNCAPWTGPYLRPYATSGGDFPIPGVPYTPGASFNVPTAGSLPGDFTGHGRTEILWYCNSNCTQPGESGSPGWQLYIPNVSGPIDRLTSVVNGIGNTASVDYKPMADTSVYTQQPKDGSTVSYPLHAMIDGGRMLVSALHVDNGGNTPLTNTYAYEGLATAPTGRGEQGFERVTITNPLGTVHSTQYAQGFPYTGMEQGHTIIASANQSQAPQLEQVCNGASANFATPGVGVLEQTCNVLATVSNIVNSSAYGTTVSPYVKIAQASHIDLNGTAISQSNATVTGIDNWGNVTGSSVYAASAAAPLALYGTMTSNTYINNPTGTPYIIGQLVNTSVTKTAPNQPNLTRSKQFDYYGQTQAPVCTPTSFGGTGAAGLLMDEITECYPSGVTPLSMQTTYGRDGFGNIIKTTQSWQDPVSHSAVNRAKTTTYETQGRFPQTVTNAIGQTETYVFYDTTGAKQNLIDINNLTTTWQADGFGRIKSEIRPDGTETDYYQKQCSGACPATAVDPLGLDLVMNPVTVTITDHVLKGSSTRIAVPEVNYGDSAGHHLRSQSYGFDGREIDTDFTYEKYGRPDITFQPTYAGTAPAVDNRKFLDELNRVMAVVTYDENGAAQSTSTTYNGLTTTVTNPLNQTKSNINNALGQLVQTIDAAGKATNFTRDAFGQLVQTIDSANNVVTITYDNLGRKISLQDPDLGLITYGIDPAGRQYNQINPNQRAKGQSTTFAHDALDRLTQRIEPDLTSNWVFDQPATTNGQAACIATASCGKLIEAYTAVPVSVNPSGKDYDRTETYCTAGTPNCSVGRPKSSSTTLYNGTYTSTNTYDNYGRSSTVTHQSGTSVPAKTYAQYYNGYLAQVARIDNTTSTPTTRVLWQANKQDAADRVTQAALGNGLALTRDYDSYTARLQDAYLTGAAGAVLQEGYSYDILGNVNNRNEYWGNGSGFSENFGYDIMNRLATSQVITNTATTTQSYQYNDIGNLIDKTGVGSCNGTSATPANPCYVYGTSGSNVAGPHAVTSIQGISGNFTYDANGNMQTGAGRTETWTSFDMPVQILGGNGSYSQFVYGPEHQRSRQVSYDAVSKNTTTLVYADAMEADITNGVTTVKTYWPMGLGVEIDVVGGATPPPATALNWTHSDRLGSIVAITDANGNLEEAMAYDAWGARRDLIGTAVTTINTTYKEVIDNKGFTGQEELDKLALVHLNGRIYDPFTARFISADPEIQDPTHSQSYNRYTYVWNNPTNDTDPTGFSAVTDQMHNAEGWTTVYSAGSGLSSLLGQLMDLGFTDFKADANGGISATPPGSANPTASPTATQQAGQGTAGGSDQVAKPKLVKDCSVGSCVVGGVRYTNNFAIPGNDPVPVKDADNNPVLGPDNKPLFAPSRANLAAISAQLSRDSFSELYTDEHKFAQAGPWDFQRIKGDDGTIIFTDAYRHFSNVAIGYANESAGLMWSITASLANHYASSNSKFNEPMSWMYPHLPQSLVKDYQIGATLWFNQTYPSDHIPVNEQYKGF